MSGYLTGRALWVQGIAGGLKLTLVALTDSAHDDGSHCYPGQRRLAAMVGVSERTIRRNLADLRDLGFIDWRQRYDEHGNRSSNQYFINIDALPHPPRTAAEFEQIITGHGRPVITGHSGSDNRSKPASLPDTAMSGDPPDRPASIDPCAARASGSNDEGGGQVTAPPEYELPPDADAIPDGIPRDEWINFEAHRANVIGRPLNSFARRTMWKRLLELDEAVRAAALDNAVEWGLKGPDYGARPRSSDTGSGKRSTRVPFDSNELASWAAARNLPAPRPGESSGAYRGRLVALVEQGPAS